MAGDAEGATHLATIEVDGTRTDEEARQIAKAVADSALVKTALFGADPNWGRIVSAAGYAGVPFEEEQLSLWLGETLLYKAGPRSRSMRRRCRRTSGAHRELTLRLVFTLGWKMHVLDLRSHL